MADLSPQMAALLLLSIAAAGWYAAARTAGDALAGSAPSPGRRAIAHAIPGFTIVLIALALGRAELAISILFASSVASLTLVLGIIIISANHTHAIASRRIWSFVLPVALISLMIGFSGGIGWMPAIMLLLEGAVLCLLWNDIPVAHAVESERAWPIAPAQIASEPASRPTALRVTQFIFALIAAVVASWAGITAAQQIAAELSVPGLGLVTSLMLAPALVLSMIGSGSHAAAEGRFDHAVATLIGFVLLNLCALLPLTTMLWLTRPIWHPPVQVVVASATGQRTIGATATTLPSIPPPPATTSTTHPAIEDFPAAAQPASKSLPYPMAVWRVDTVLLIATGLLLLPVALGRWSLGRLEGAGLIAAYVMYMLLTTLMAR